MGISFEQRLVLCLRAQEALAVLMARAAEDRAEPPAVPLPLALLDPSSSGELDHAAGRDLEAPELRRSPFLRGLLGAHGQGPGLLSAHAPRAEQPGERPAEAPGDLGLCGDGGDGGQQQAVWLTSSSVGVIGRSSERALVAPVTVARWPADGPLHVDFEVAHRGDAAGRERERDPVLYASSYFSLFYPRYF